MIRTPVPQLKVQHNTLSQCSKWKQKKQEWWPLLKSCNCIQELKQVHAHIVKLGGTRSGTSNLICVTALSEWGSMEYACSIFRQLDDPDAFTFNSVIRAHVMKGEPEKGILVYEAMQGKGIQPDNFTYPSLLKACSQLSALGEGMQIHGHVLKHGLAADTYVQNSLINMYGKCGELKHSCTVFHNMEQRTVASWSALISCHSLYGFWSESLSLLGDMAKQGCRPEESTLVSVLSSCSNLGVSDYGRCVHGFLLRKTTELNVIVQTSLIDMYVKCGCIDKGFSLFHLMPTKNKLSYSVMISGFALYSQTREALMVFQAMLKQGLAPDETIYVCVLTACSHAGLVEEGHKYFRKMKLEHNIKPTVQHYGCMVDLLGRTGRLIEAHELIQGMPIEPNDVVWRCLLSACKYHKNWQLAQIASENLFRTKQHKTSDYILLSNIYAQARMWKNVAETRKKLIDGRSTNQTPGGFCLVEVKRKMHRFVSQDKSHPQSHAAVYEMMHQMEWQLRFDGYSADTSQVLLDVDEEEKLQRLRNHCQKLAIAFALIQTRQGSTIRIVRNFQMCGDCHTYTKYVSKIFGRTIIVRDENRFHQFNDGACSCRG